MELIIVLTLIKNFCATWKIMIKMKLTSFQTSFQFKWVKMLQLRWCMGSLALPLQPPFQGTVLQRCSIGKGALKICSKFTGEHPCQNAISIKHWCSPVNLLHIFRRPFLKSTSACCSFPFTVFTQETFSCSKSTLKSNRNTKKVWNMFKVNNKDTRTMSLKSLCCLYC